MNRNTWLSYLTSNGRLTRLLYLSGDTTYQESEYDSTDIEELQQKLAASGANWEYLLAAHFLCKKQVVEFFLDQLPDLLRAINRSTQKKTDAGVRNIRGKVLWSETSKRSLSA